VKKNKTEYGKSTGKFGVAKIFILQEGSNWGGGVKIHVAKKRRNQSKERIALFLQGWGRETFIRHPANLVRKSSIAKKKLRTSFPCNRIMGVPRGTTVFEEGEGKARGKNPDATLPRGRNRKGIEKRAEGDVKRSSGRGRRV